MFIIEKGDLPFLMHNSHVLRSLLSGAIYCLAFMSVPLVLLLAEKMELNDKTLLATKPQTQFASSIHPPNLSYSKLCHVLCIDCLSFYLISTELLNKTKQIRKFQSERAHRHTYLHDLYESWSYTNTFSINFVCA